MDDFVIIGEIRQYVHTIDYSLIYLLIRFEDFDIGIAFYQVFYFY